MGREVECGMCMWWCGTRPRVAAGKGAAASARGTTIPLTSTQALSKGRPDHLCTICVSGRISKHYFFFRGDFLPPPFLPPFLPPGLGPLGGSGLVAGSGLDEA